ncbi:MAG TPA: hypothetical protein VM576_04110 [Xanthomonadaceae bacterium]|nr:hypothetical protein [Xanthomonadaceae bacterium]
MEYISEAVALAREELEKRGIASGEPVVVDKGFASASEPEERNKSLHDALKVLCFLLTPLPGLLIACWQFFSGRNKAAKDALIWTLCGLIFWTSVKMLFRGG